MSFFDIVFSILYAVSNSSPKERWTAILNVCIIICIFLIFIVSILHIFKIKVPSYLSFLRPKEYFWIIFSGLIIALISVLIFNFFVLPIL